MIIWKGYGFLVLVIAVAIGAVVSLIFGSIGSTEDTGAAVGAIISGVVIWFLSNKLNSNDKNKLQYWAFIIAGIGIIMICDILIHGKSSL
jgi:hypothetical protein